MKYKLRQKLYSQNFLRNPKLVAKLIRNSSIGKKDTVLEIGPGKGIITSELLKVTKKVIAVELDKKLCLYLKERFKDTKNLELMNANFLSFKLPSYPYKVFSNTPFIITTDVIRKLTSDDNLIEACLIVQKEAAKKFIGMPYDNKNSMMATLLKPWFEIEAVWQFRKSNFVPQPNVVVVMITIRRRETPFVPWSSLRNYRDFVLYTYNRSKVAKLEFDKLLTLFDRYEQKTGERQKKNVSQKAKEFLAHQRKIQKIHRTRKDKHWRKYKS